MKKAINIDFNQKKAAFDDGFVMNSAKMALFRANSVETLNELLIENNIVINPSEIIEKYQDFYNLDNLVTYYVEAYRKELDLLNLKKELLDEDVIYFYFDKVIRENYDVKTLSDPCYIFDYDFEKAAYNKDIDGFIQFLKQVNGLMDTQDNNDLAEIFEPFCIDLEEEICDFMMYEVYNWNLSDKKNVLLADLLVSLTDNFFLENPIPLIIEIFHLKQKIDLEECLEYFEEKLNEYPFNKIQLYSGLILNLIIKDDSPKQLIESLYQEAKEIDDTDLSDQMYLDIIEENYNGYKEKETLVN